jgi:hypothetical protein
MTGTEIAGAVVDVAVTDNPNSCDAKLKNFRPLIFMQQTRNHVLRFTSMPSVKLGLICFGLLFDSEARIHKRFSERHGLSRLGSERLVPNPSETSAKLDQVEQSINNWDPSRGAPDVSIAGVSATTKINVTTTAGSPAPPETPLGVVTDLQQALKEIQGQSNTGIAQLSGTTAMNTMVIDVLRSDVKKFEQQVQKNFSRIDGLLNELGDLASSGGVGSLIDSVNQIQSQLSVVAAGGSIATVVQGFTQRIGDLGSAVTGLDQRVAGLEKGSAANAQSAESADSTLSAATSISFLTTSWTGRVALGGAAFGLVALILSIVAITSLPKKPEPAADPATEEQVLMEAGEGQAEGEAEGAEYYDDAAQEEEAQQ